MVSKQGCVLHHNHWKRPKDIGFYAEDPIDSCKQRLVEGDLKMVNVVVKHIEQDFNLTSLQGLDNEPFVKGVEEERPTLPFSLACFESWVTVAAQVERFLQIQVINSVKLSYSCKLLVLVAFDFKVEFKPFDILGLQIIIW